MWCTGTTRYLPPFSCSRKNDRLPCVVIGHPHRHGRTHACKAVYHKADQGAVAQTRLKAPIAEELQQAHAAYEAGGAPARVFKECRHQARDSGSCERRVVGKAEHLGKGANPRFIVSSLPSEEYDARTLYEDLYCARGYMENRIKELQLALFADRTSTARRPMRCTPTSCVCTFLRLPTC